MDTRTVPMEVMSRASTKDRLRALYSNLMNWSANHLADGQTAITQRMAEVVHIPSHQLWGTWPSGVVLERFSPALERRQWPKEGEPICLIYIGSLNYERNLESLCQAVEEANKLGMNFHLSLVGDGSSRRELEEIVFRMDGCLQVALPVPHEQVPDLLSQAHVGVLPFPDEIKFRVSSPIKLFEYMGAGLPVMATRIACHVDVIGDETYAFWAEEASVAGLLAALGDIWKKRACLSMMVQRAFIASRRWTWRESAEKLKAALEYGIKKDRCES